MPTTPKPQRHPDPAYRRWIRQERCTRCCRFGCDAHHLRRRGQTRRAMDGGNCIPLCRACHTYVHQHPAEERRWRAPYRQHAAILWRCYQHEQRRKKA